MEKRSATLYKWYLFSALLKTGAVHTLSCRVSKVQLLILAMQIPGNTTQTSPTRSDNRSLNPLFDRSSFTLLPIIFSHEDTETTEFFLIDIRFSDGSRPEKWTLEKRATLEEWEFLIVVRHC